MVDRIPGEQRKKTWKIPGGGKNFDRIPGEERKKTWKIPIY